MQEAVELDPSSAELKLSYEEAKAKASEGDDLETASSLQTEPVAKGGDGLSVEKITKPETMPPREHDAEIRSMVDGLADRLRVLPMTSRAGLSLCALEWCLVRERSRQQRSVRRLRSSRMTWQHRARLRPRRSSLA